MSASINRQVQEALRNTLKAKLPDKVAAAKRGVTYGFQPEDFSAVKCPAIFIYEGDWTKEFESIRGVTAGVADAGIAQRRYQFDVDVYLRGRKADELREELQQWADGIVAVVEDWWALGTTAIDAEAKAGQPTVPLESGSSVLMATRVQVVADVYVFQGSTTL